MSDGDGVRVGEVHVKHETGKAILVEVHGEEVWIPKSVVHADSEVWSKENGDGMLVVEAWFAEKEGLD